MKKFYLALLLFLFSCQLMAQAPATTAAGYYFYTAPNYSLVNMSGGSQVIGPNLENVSTITFEMGFNFNFAGTNYSRFSVGSSGMMGLGNVPVSPIFYEPRNQILHPYYVYPILSPWSDELHTASDGGVSYKIITVGGLKKLVIEWRVKASSDENPANNYNKTFQVWLSEGTNRIQYVFGNSPVRAENSFIGIAKSFTDYKLVNSSTHTVTQMSNNDWPGAGRSYTFSPVEIIGGALPIALDEEGNTVHVNCFGSANGAITLGTISGGDGNYTISWTGPNGFTATGPAISNLGAGIYNFTITDGSNAEPLSGARTINEPAVLNATVTASQACAGNFNGSITISNPLGGSGNYEYLINNENWQSSGSFGSLGAGSYTVQMRDANTNNCTKNLGTYTVTDFALFATLNSAATCAGTNNGSISISNAGGGSGNYEYRINNGNWQSSNVFSGLNAGIYTVQMRDVDFNACVKNLADQIITEYSLNASVNSTSTCAGTSNGSISISNAGGGSGNYEFNINNGNWQGSGLFTNLSPGSYSVQMRDANTGCIKLLANQTVTEFSLNASLSTSAACQGTNNGSISISNATGGSGNYAYQLNNGNWQTTTVFTGLNAGTYTLHMRDANNTGCIKNLGNFIVAQAMTPAVSILANAPAFCNALTLTASTVNGAGYVWSNGQTGMSISLNNNDADGQYTVIVTNANGCSGSASYQYVKQNILNSYTIVGLKTISLGEYNIVNGSVGLTAAGQTTKVNKNSLINGFIKSPVINLTQPVTVTQGSITGVATLTLPTMLFNTAVTSNLPNLSIPDDYSGPAITYNVNQLTIGRRAQVTLTGNVFGKIIIKEAADVIFTAADISINEIDAENGKTLAAGIDYLSLSFAPNTIIRVKNKIDLGDRNQVNGTGSTFYMGDLNTDDEQISIKGKNTTINANMYMLQGTLSITNNDLNAPCIMNGTYIAETIISEKNITWAAIDCNAEAVQQLTQTQPGMVVEGIFSIPEQKTTVNELNSAKQNIAVYPSPTTGKFTLQMNTGGSKAEFIITNQVGLEILRESHLNIIKGHAFKFDLGKYPSGLYYIKVITGNGVYTKQIVITK